MNKTTTESPTRNIQEIIAANQEEVELVECFINPFRSEDPEPYRGEILARQTAALLHMEIRTLLGRTGPAFELGRREQTWRATRRGSQLLFILKLSRLRDIKQALPDYEFHPLANIFLALIEGEPRLFEPTTEAADDSAIKAMAERMNHLLADLDAKASTHSVQLAVRNWEARSTRNFQSLKYYLNYLIDYHKRLLVVRLDLHFKSDAAENDNPLRAKDSLDRLLRNRRSKPTVFKHMLGYAWRMEHTPSRGYHFHLILLFDTERVREAITYGDLVGEYWRDVITSGAGTFWNCNKQEYLRNGLGIIRCDDLEKRKIFIRDVAFYLTKVDKYYSLKKPEGHDKLKCFGKGIPPKIKAHSGAGRPRTFKYRDIG